MKSLKESILKSVKAGGFSKTEDAKKWFEKSNAFKNIKRYINVISLDVQFEGKNYFSFHIKGDNGISGLYCTFDNRDVISYGKLPYNIAGIYLNDKPLNIEYDMITFDDFENECPKIVKDEIVFIGCKINNLNILPKNCKQIKFVKSITLANSFFNEVEKIENISVDTLLNERSGLKCKLNNFKNVTIKKPFDVCEYQFSNLFAGDNGKILSQETNDELNNFAKNNNIPVKNLTLFVNNNFLRKKHRMAYNEYKFVKKKEQYTLKKI